MAGTMMVPVTPGTFGEAMRIGEVMAESGFFEDTRSAAQAVVKMLAGRELGFGPVASMTGVDIIKGKVAIKPKLLASAVDSSPQYDYKVKEHNDTECRIEFFKNGELRGTSTFTMADATKAGLAGKEMWGKYPRNLLWARAMSNGVNWYCAGIFGGPVYTAEELGADVDAEGEIVEAPVTAAPEGTAATDAVTPGPGPPPGPAPAPTLDEAIANGDIEGVEAPDRTIAQAAAEAAAPGTPLELARSLGIADATQRFILIGVAGVEDATDLDAAYRSLSAEQRDLVSAELAKRAKT